MSREEAMACCVFQLGYDKTRKVVETFGHGVGKKSEIIAPVSKGISPMH